MAEPAAEPKQSLVALRRRREQVIEALCEGYAADLLEEDEFERRLDVAHRVTDLVHLDQLVEDLEISPDNLPDPIVEIKTALVPAEKRAKSKFMIAIMGGATRKGQWSVPRKLRVFTLMGGAEIDLREVVLPPGLTEIKVYTVMGGTDIIVPPELAVECEGIAIMGGFDMLERAPVDPDPDAPRVKISGFALMGGFDISTRLPGESARQARRRRRAERKAAQHALKSGKPPKRLKGAD